MKSTFTENAGPQFSWCWIYSILFIIWSAFCIAIAAFFVYSNIQDTRAIFVRYSNAYAEHIYDKENSNQIILEGFAALSTALVNTNKQESSRYARQVMARHPHILSLDVVQLEHNSSQNDIKQHNNTPAIFNSIRESRSLASQSTFHSAVFREYQSKPSPLLAVKDSGPAEFISPALQKSVEPPATVSSRPFYLASGKLVYATFMPIQTATRRSYSNHSMPADSLFAVKMIVDAAKMALPDDISPRGNLHLVVYQPEFSAEDPAGQISATKQSDHGALEKFLLPNFQFHKEIGQSLNIFAEKQLGWSDINLTLLAMLLLIIALSSVILATSLRTHHLKRMADKQNSKHLWFLANHDALTRLPNRNLFMDRMDQAIARAQRQGINFGILFIDLNGFKHINDTYGHDTGDQSLKKIATRLQTCLRADDSVARIGGDEFVVLLEGVTDIAVMESAAQKIRYCLSMPFTVNQHQLTISASIGKAAFPLHGKNSADLLKYADNKMYTEKQSHDSYAM